MRAGRWQTESCRRWMSQRLGKRRLRQITREKKTVTIMRIAITNKVHCYPQPKKTEFKTIALTICMCNFFLFIFLMQLKVMSWNTRGVISFIVSLAKLLHQCNPNYAILSEHKLRPTYSKYLDSVIRDSPASKPAFMI